MMFLLTGIFYTILFIITIQQISLNSITIGKGIVEEGFAQTSNASNVLVPSNMNKIELTLKNDQSASSSSLQDSPFLVALVSAGSAIFGGFVGSYMTNRSNMQMENIRYDREKGEQDEIEANVRALILHNLKASSDILDTIKEGDFGSERQIHDIDIVLRSFHKEYGNLSLEMKSRLFKPDVLTAVQEYYDYFDTFSEALHDIIRRYDNAVKSGDLTALENFNKEMSDLGADELNEYAKKAINLINKNI